MRNTLTALSLTALLISPTLTSHAAQECLGRLTFSLPNLNNFEWAVSQRNTGIPAFTKEVYTGGSRWYYDDFSIKVSSRRPIRDYNYQYTNYEIDRNIRVNGIKDELASKRRILESYIKGQKKQRIELAQGKTFKHYEIIDDEKIKHWQGQVDNLQQQLDYLVKHPVTRVPLAYPDAFTVYNDTAYFWRNERIYTFSHTNHKANISLDQLNQWLAPFSTRKLGEVPQGLGYCFPYGFMRDDGKADYEIKNAFRFKDQPNVLYVIYTGTVRHQKIDEYTLAKYKERYTVATHGIMEQGMKLPTDQGYQYSRTEQTYPISLGELGEIKLKGELINGVNPANPKDTQTAYLIYGALRDTMAQKIDDPSKPYIGIQIIGYPKKTGADYNLPNDPPTPEQAIKRLQPLLKTLRLSLQASGDNPPPSAPKKWPPCVTT